MGGCGVGAQDALGELRGQPDHEQIEIVRGGEKLVVLSRGPAQQIAGRDLHRLGPEAKAASASGDQVQLGLGVKVPWPPGRRLVAPDLSPCGSCNGERLVQRGSHGKKDSSNYRDASGPIRTGCEVFADDFGEIPDMKSTMASLHRFCLLATTALGCASAPPSDHEGGTAQPGDGQLGPGKFTLAWEDNFDAFDSTRWSLMTHSWNGNLAQFSVDNTRFESGIASILLTRADNDTAKPFRGVEMRSKSTLTYGKVQTRARFAKGSGVVSAAVLIYTPWPADDWNELDMEYLPGRNGMQFNTMVYDGPPVQKPVTTSVTPTQTPKLVDLGFDATAEFHVYTIEWTPSAVRFLVDDEVKYEWNASITLMKLPQNLLLTIWASSSASWAGAVGDDTAPTQADFDWVRVYDWVP